MTAPASAEYDHLIIGGGIYGCYVALQLRQRQPDARIAILERKDDLLCQASYNNQARVHNGYHYPRSVLTGIRSRINVPRFLREFGDAVRTDFQQYYAIGRRRSNVTPRQFEQFCRLISADLQDAPGDVYSLFDSDLIEAVYAVSEPVFDAVKLRHLMQERLACAGVKVILGCEALGLDAGANIGQETLAVNIANHDGNSCGLLRCRFLYNCTYSRLNAFLAQSGLTPIKLRHEATEMALIEPPTRLRDVAVTIMCGPFFSLLPFPARGLSSLSHVAYTPHYSWSEEPEDSASHSYAPSFPLQTRFGQMWRDASRYLPALKQCDYVDSLWETKTILPQSDANDSRPILFKRDPAAPNVISILGGKIDNIFDLDDIFAGIMNLTPEPSPA